MPNFADGEMAWTSFSKPACCFDYRYYGNLQGNTSAKQRIHPTQKPIELYEWILSKFAKEGDKILDTHLGSGTSRIACHNKKFDFIGFELEKEYFDKHEQFYRDETAQLSIF